MGEFHRHCVLSCRMSNYSSFCHSKEKIHIDNDTKDTRPCPFLPLPPFLHSLDVTLKGFFCVVNVRYSDSKVRGGSVLGDWFLQVAYRREDIVTCVKLRICVSQKKKKKTEDNHFNIFSLMKVE